MMDKIRIFFKQHEIHFFIGGTIFFILWMLFFDANSLKNQMKLDSEISNLQKEILFLQKEIEKDKEHLKDINSLEGKEKFGRENYYLKRDDEDIYIIEFDTIR